MPEAGDVGRSFNGALARALQLIQSAGRIKWALADQVLVSGSNFLSTIVLARALGIEEFGRYVLAWAIIVFMQNIQYAAVSSAMLSIGPKQSIEKAPSYFGALFAHQAFFRSRQCSAGLCWDKSGGKRFCGAEAERHRVRSRRGGVMFTNARFPSPLLL